MPASEQEAANDKQRKALVALKLWLTDWSDALRTELPYNDQLRLGIRTRARRKGSSVLNESVVDTDDVE